MIRSAWVVCLVALLPAVGALQAQSVYGEIRGTITDSSGAVISGAAVTVTNNGTGEARKVQTDTAGNYAAVNLEAAPDSASRRPES